MYKIDSSRQKEEWWLLEVVGCDGVGNWYLIGFSVFIWKDQKTLDNGQNFTVINSFKMVSFMLYIFATKI